MAGNSTDPGRSVTSKVTAILMVFADGDVHTLTEIAASADLSASTAHRLASELVACRLLERSEERHYRIGLPLRIIASELGPIGDPRPSAGWPQPGPGEGSSAA